MPTAVQRQQYLEAVSQLADLSTLYQAVPMDPADEIWIEFNAANCVTFGGALANFTQSVYGWSDDDMYDLFKRAQMIATACSRSER